MGSWEEKRLRRFRNRAAVLRVKREPRQAEVLVTMIQHSPSGYTLIRADVPENEPVRVHSPSGLQSTQPRP